MAKTPTRADTANIRVDAETYRLLEAIKAEEGIPYAAQINRAMKLFAEQRGYKIPPAAGK